jgi:hypothetical protein
MGGVTGGVEKVLSLYIKGFREIYGRCWAFLDNLSPFSAKTAIRT